MPEHVSLNDPNIHEPKGISTANANTVYVADGSGSGDWLAQSAPSNTALCIHMADVSTAGSVYVPAPLAGTVSRISATAWSAPGTADVTLTGYIDGVLIVDGALTIPTSVTAGSNVIHAIPASDNVTSIGSVIEIASDGASTGVVPVQLTIYIT